MSRKKINLSYSGYSFEGSCDVYFEADEERFVRENAEFRVSLCRKYANNPRIEEAWISGYIQDA